MSPVTAGEVAGPWKSGERETEAAGASWLMVRRVACRAKQVRLRTASPIASIVRNGLISSAETILNKRLDARVARGESLLGVNYHTLAGKARALPIIDAPPDPLVGWPGRMGTASFELPRSGGLGGSTGLPLFNDWVCYRTGDYFFTPSVSTLRQWGGG